MLISNSYVSLPEGNWRPVKHNRNFVQTRLVKGWWIKGPQQIRGDNIDYSIWLMVYLPLWKMMEFVSWDDEIPNWKAMFQTTNQIISIQYGRRSWIWYVGLSEIWYPQNYTIEMAKIVGKPSDLTDTSSSDKPMTKDATEQVFSMVDFTNCSNFEWKMKNTSRYVAIKIQIPHATTIIIPILPVGSLNSSWVFIIPQRLGPPGVRAAKLVRVTDGTVTRSSAASKQRGAGSFAVRSCLSRFAPPRRVLGNPVKSLSQTMT